MRKGQINVNYLVFKEWTGNIMVGCHNEGFLRNMLSSCSPLLGRIEQEKMDLMTTGEL